VSSTPTKLRTRSQRWLSQPIKLAFVNHPTSHNQVGES
jgi:hypothetical protein